MGAPHPAGERILELDGIRGLAILLVVVWHYVGGSIAPPPGSLGAYAMIPLRLTYTGVDLFFVLSGFLIGGILLDSRALPGYFRVFYYRRAHRILPLYAVMVALFLLAVALHGWGVPGLSYFTQFSLPAVAYLTFTQNLWMAATGSHVNGLSLSWSLAVEEQFYLVLPLLVWLCPRRVLVAVVLALLVVGVALRPALGQDASYMLTLCRMDALGLGVLAAVAARTERLRAWLSGSPRPLYLLGLALLLGVAAVTLRVINVFPLGYSVLAAFYATLLALGVFQPRSLVAAALRVGWLRWLGGVSYGVYLLHVPLLFLAYGVLLGRDEGYPSITDWPSLGASVAALAATLALAVVSWRYFEAPLVRRGRRLRYAAVPAPADQSNRLRAVSVETSLRAH